MIDRDRRHFLELGAFAAAAMWLPEAGAGPLADASVADSSGAAAGAVSPYMVRDGGIVTRAGRGYFSNRPLYGRNDGSFVLAGDQPLLRVAQGKHVFGSLLLAYAPRGGEARWLHDLSDVEAFYRDGVAGWTVRDAGWPGVVVRLEAVPTVDGAGMALRLQVEGAAAGDELLWAYGGVHRTARDASAARDVCGYPQLLKQAFPAEQCARNSALLDGDSFRVSLEDAAASGRWSVPVAMVVSDAAALSRPAALAVAAPAERGSNDGSGGSGGSVGNGGGLPLVAGRIAAVHLHEAYLAVAVGVAEPAAAAAAGAAPLAAPADARAAFDAAVAHRRNVGRMLVLSTPDEQLNALGPVAALAIDGLWRPPVFMHGAMLWNVPLVGWRTLFGATALGWHERVAAQAAHYIAKQVTASDKTAAMTDPVRQHSQQHPDSRLYGRGRIASGQQRYDMQSQFFDQLVHSWRATGDAAFEARLRPALELHLEWLRECFDPDGDGLYESYLNSWPTDSVWYNGGGSVEATVYAWRGHGAALEMARRAGDNAAEAHHEAVLARIRAGFFGKLWNAGKGHPGAYIEQGGHRRRHDDPWLYSIFLALDAETLLSPEQGVQALHYTKSTLENQAMPLGGRTVVASNWVPGIWSVRENWPGDNYHLALAYFQAGLAEDGWDILRGASMQAAYNGAVPGNLGGLQGGTDFGDCVHMFCRAVVEGLFGYRPDYPNASVLFAPQIPAAWPQASIRTPDMALAFSRTGRRLQLDVELTRPAQLRVRLPVRGRPTAVRVDGRGVAYRLVAGFGQSVVEITLPACAKAGIAIDLAMPAVALAPQQLSGNVGAAVTLDAGGARIVELADPEGVLTGARTQGGRVRATLAANPGQHTVFVRTDEAGAPAWRVFHLRVEDPLAEQARRAASLQGIPPHAAWATVPLGGALNGDIRGIFKQSYMSPRPQTVSLRIGSDGYSPWTFTHWKSGPPEIGLELVDGLRAAPGQLRTPQGVPFAWEDQPAADARNVAFASLWDNWPDQVSVPVNRLGAALFLLIAGSTNNMQCHIANAVLRLHYADGVEERLELIPPYNYWNLCPVRVTGNSVEQASRSDYTDPVDAFVVRRPYPETVQLGANCRAMLLNRKLRPGRVLARVTLEALSQEVVVGLMGLSILNPGMQNV